MMIYFCTQISNRMWQFTQTVESNLSVISANDNCRWHIVAYDDCHSEICGLVNHNPQVIVTRGQDKYRIDHAKNLAANIGEPDDYVFNLDCDNFIDQYIIDTITKDPSQVIHDCRTLGDGTYGRIGMPKSLFDSIGGYDLYSEGCGGHDVLLLAKTIGRPIVIPPRSPLNAMKLPIPNTKQDTRQFVEGDKEWSEINREVFHAAFRDLTFPHTVIPLKAHTFGRLHGMFDNRKLFGNGATYVRLRYKVEFSPGFDFSRGGKLPGMTIGPMALVCGGYPQDKGFAARIMWREGGSSSLYLYHPDQQGKYGDDFSLGVNFEPGKQHLIEMVYDKDLLTVSIDGAAHSMTLSRPRPLNVCPMFHIFRGGSDETWASPVDGYVTIHPVRD